MKNITMRDIARAVGVSAVSVSKALSGDSGVSEALRQRIISAAQDMGYSHQRHSVSRALDVGVLVPERFFAPDSYYSMLAPMLARELASAGHFCLLETLTEAAEAALEIPRLIRARHVDGLILLGEPSRAYLRAITQLNVPMVFMDFYDDAASAPAVVGDNAYGAYRLTCHLINAGHRDIAYVGNTRLTSSIMDRFLGYYRAMLTHQLPVREDWLLNDRDAHGDVIAPELPAQMPTAFVCNCDVTAVRLIEKLQAAGYRVPEDVSVVGYDDFPATPMPLPAVTTFSVDYAQMLRFTVQLMIDRCNGLPELPNRLVVGGEPRYKNSHAPR